MSSPEAPLAVAVQEHAANDASRQSMARVASAATCDLLLGPHHGSQDSSSAGVGFSSQDGCTRAQSHLPCSNNP
eukprot:13697455-Alexandrium_andersonii.AAC.1